MTTVLKSSIQAFNMQTLDALKEKYPDAVIRVEVEANLENERMNEDAFWEVIACIDWKSKDYGEIVQAAIDRLSQYPVEEIYRFHDMLAEKLYLLDGERFAVRLGSNKYDPSRKHYFSVDDFLYARCGVVARGKDFFYSVLQHPARMPKEFTFEPLLSLPKKSYQLKTSLQDYNYQPETWYETFSNGTGWPGIKPLKDRILDPLLCLP